MAIYPPIKKIFNWQLWNQKTTNYLPLNGAGTPLVTGIVPRSIGQLYVDTAANKAYIAKAVTGNVTDWVILN